MRARVWGCRGSLAAPGPETVRYGGNTSCVEVEVDDDIVMILDAGSGIRSLGVTLAAGPPKAIHILLTHLHLDHLQGLAFFAPFWIAGTELHVWGPPSPTKSLAERVAGYVSPPLFPVHLSDVPSRPTFHDAPEQPWAIGRARVTAQPVSHQGPTIGYRIEADGRAIAYMPDHEPALGIDLASLEPEWMSGESLAREADVLLHDAQYTPDEYRDHVGWGHSSVLHAITLAKAARVRQLLLFHHDPSHSDAELEELLGAAIDTWDGSDDRPVLAYEGMTITLDRAGISMGPVSSSPGSGSPVTAEPASPASPLS
jgi:phosphoribosyl 1,2-cyclic phosphodiesterase